MEKFFILIFLFFAINISAVYKEQINCSSGCKSSEVGVFDSNTQSCSCQQKN